MSNIVNRYLNNMFMAVKVYIEFKDYSFQPIS